MSFMSNNELNKLDKFDKMKYLGWDEYNEIKTNYSNTHIVAKRIISFSMFNFFSQKIWLYDYNITTSLICGQL